MELCSFAQEGEIKHKPVDFTNWHQQSTGLFTFILLCGNVFGKAQSWWTDHFFFTNDAAAKISTDLAHFQCICFIFLWVRFELVIQTGVGEERLWTVSPTAQIISCCCCLSLLSGHMETSFVCRSSVWRQWPRRPDVSTVNCVLWLAAYGCLWLQGDQTEVWGPPALHRDHGESILNRPDGLRLGCASLAAIWTPRLSSSCRAVDVGEEGGGRAAGGGAVIWIWTGLVNLSVWVGLLFGRSDLHQCFLRLSESLRRGEEESLAARLNVWISIFKP